MKKKFDQSYSKREDALFEKMSSRRLLRWYNNRLSKIDSQEKIWLIIFTRPNNYHPKERETSWWLKFWVWDSENNCIIGENILCHYQFHDYDKTLLASGSDVAECYIHREVELIVFRKREERAHMIYDFSGNIVVQTENNNTNQYEYVSGDEYYYSTFLNKDLFVAKIGSSLSLYHLNEKTNDVSPKKTVFWNSGTMRIDIIFQMIFQGIYCFISATDNFNGILSEITTLSIYVKDRDRDMYMYAFKACFDTGVKLCGIDIKQDEEYLTLSLQCDDILKKGAKNTVLQLPKNILK